MKQLVKKFKEVNFVQVPREENMETDALVKATSTKGTMVEYDKVQYIPSIDLPEVLMRMQIVIFFFLNV